MLARAPIAAMAAVPRAGAGPAVLGRPDAVLDAAGAGDPRGEIRRHPRARSERPPARRAAARREAVAGGARCDPGRTAARAGRSHPRPGRSRRCPRGPAPPAHAETSSRDRPGRGREGVDAQPRLPAERSADRRDARRRRGVSETMQGPTLPGEAAPDLGAEDERQPSARDVELPAGAAVPGHGEDPEGGRMAGDPVEQAKTGQAGQLDGTTDPDRGGRSEGRGRRARTTPVVSMESSGSTGRRRARPTHPAPRPAPARPGSPGPRGSRAASATAAGRVARRPTRRPPRPRRRRTHRQPELAPLLHARRAPLGHPARSRRSSSRVRASRRRTPRAAGRRGRRRCSMPRTPRTGGGRRRTSRRDRRAPGCA